MNLFYKPAKPDKPNKPIKVWPTFEYTFIISNGIGTTQL